MSKKRATIGGKEFALAMCEAFFDAADAHGLSNDNRLKASCMLVAAVISTAPENGRVRLIGDATGMIVAALDACRKEERGT